MPVLNLNKRRIYLAYYRRTPSEINPTRYHSGIFIAPKSPDSKSDALNSFLYHVMNDIDRTGTQTIWEYKPKKTRARTAMLVGLLLLGKVPNSITGEKIGELVQDLPTPRYASDDPTWLCCDWLCAALPVLVDEGIVPPLPDTPQQVWQRGYDFLVGLDAKGDMEAPIPTCDVHGSPIASEMGPLR